MNSTPLQVARLQEKFDELQQIHGEKSLCSIYGAGKIKSPRLMLVFMNPTGRNVSAKPEWKGIRAPWLGTKQVWKMFQDLSILSDVIYTEISKMKPDDWSEVFAEEVYAELARASVYVTNLAKCTQIDARPLRDAVFKEYREHFLQELTLINPEHVVTFGNQVSSVLLQKQISVSQYAGAASESLKVNDLSFAVYPTFYPVGQGRRNLPLAVARVKEILLAI